MPEWNDVMGKRAKRSRSKLPQPEAAAEPLGMSAIPRRQLRNAATIAAPIVFAVEFASSVVRPLWPYSAYVVPSLLLVTLVLLLPWYQRVRRPAMQRYTNGIIDREQYLTAAFDSPLAKWLSFCVFSLVIFLFLGAVRLVSSHEEASFWNKAVRHVQKNLPKVREATEKKAPEMEKAKIALKKIEEALFDKLSNSANSISSNIEARSLPLEINARDAASSIIRRFKDKTSTNRTAQEGLSQFSDFSEAAASKIIQ